MAHLHPGHRRQRLSALVFLLTLIACGPTESVPEQPTSPDLTRSDTTPRPQLAERLSRTENLTAFERVEALAAEPAAPGALAGEDFLGFVIEQVGDVAAAPEQLERILDRGPAARPAAGEQMWRARLLYAIGGLMARRGEDIEASERFEQALKLQPDLRDARIRLADSLYRQRLFDQAVTHYSTLLESEPENTDVLLKRASAWLKLERFDAARVDLEQIVALDPGNGKARLPLAVVLRRADRPADAIIQLEQALRTDLTASERLLAHRTVASLLPNEARDREALTHFEAAIALAPEDIELKRGLARLLATSPNDATRDGDRALALAEELFGADRSVTHAEILAMALAAAGRFEEAANWQRRLIAEAARFGYLDEIPRLRQAQNRYKQRRPAVNRSADQARRPGIEK